MDQKQIEEIVRSVMASMGQTAPAPSEAKCATTNCAAPVTSESCALDLGSAEAKAWIGVENPHRADVLTELRRSTVARVCTGRAGPGCGTRLYGSAKTLSISSVESGIAGGLIHT